MPKKSMHASINCNIPIPPKRHIATVQQCIPKESSNRHVVRVGKGDEVVDQA
jgi:hypothetical protein